MSTISIDIDGDLITRKWDSAPDGDAIVRITIHHISSSANPKNRIGVALGEVISWVQGTLPEHLRILVSQVTGGYLIQVIDILLWRPVDMAMMYVTEREVQAAKAIRFLGDCVNNFSKTTVSRFREEEGWYCELKLWGR